MDPNIMNQIAQQAGAPAPEMPPQPVEAPVNPLDAENQMILKALIKRLEFNGKIAERGATPAPESQSMAQLPPEVPPQM